MPRPASTPPSGPPVRAAVTTLRPRGPLAGMTASEVRPRLLGPSSSGRPGRGPKKGPRHRAPDRDQTAEGALPPECNWTLLALLPPSGQGQAGSSTIREALASPFPALPARALSFPLGTCRCPSRPQLHQSPASHHLLPAPSSLLHH